MYVPTSDAVSKAITLAVSGKADTSHGTHVTTSTCVTGIKLGSSTTVSTGVVNITPSNIGAAASSHGTHVSTSSCVTSFNGSTGAVTFNGMIPNGNVSWKTSSDISYDTDNKCMYFTPSSNCFIILFTNLNKDRQVFITVNNAVVTIFFEGNNGAGANCCFPVKANKTVRIYYGDDLRSKLVTPVYDASSAKPISNNWCVGIMT